MRSCWLPRLLMDCRAVTPRRRASRRGPGGLVDARRIGRPPPNCRSAARIARNGKVVYLATSGRRATPRPLCPLNGSIDYRIASMTKPVTSVAVMMLREQGKLALDDPASKFIPGVQGDEVLAASPTGKRADRHRPGPAVHHDPRPLVAHLRPDESVLDCPIPPCHRGGRLRRPGRKPGHHRP